MEWQPIETAPKETEVIIINNRGIFVAQFSLENPPDDCLSNFWSVSDGKYYHNLLGSMPTHWMQLPDKPTKK